MLLFSKLIFALSFSALSAMSYPESWWTPVVDQDVPSWEILPQAASLEKKEVILSKRNELGKLSNFASTPFTIVTSRYASIEGLWQSMKFPESSSDPRFAAQSVWPKARNDVAGLTAFDALRAGKEAEKIMIKHSITWVSFMGYKIEYKGADSEAYYDIIEAATRAKIEQNPEVKKILLSTGDLTLRPDHHEDKDGTQAWKYYEIYMKLRSELQKNPKKPLYADDWFKQFQKKYKLLKL